MNFHRLSELAALSESDSALITKVKDLCKQHGCSMRSAKAADGYVDFELAGESDYSDIGKVFDAVDGEAPKWRRASNMGYVTFTVKDAVKESLITEDIGELVDKYIDTNKMYHFEGPGGVQKFAKLVGVFGYSNIDEFLEDNSGAIQAMIEWISGMSIPEWRAALAAEVGEHEHAPEEQDDEAQ